MKGRRKSRGFDEEARYDEFPTGASEEFGPDQGFNRWIQLNDERWFTDEARRDPVFREFLNAPFSVNYAQFKSSHREAEYFVHKPHRAMRGLPGLTDDDPGIEGEVARFPESPHIVTMVVNHERTLAKKIMRSITIEDGAVAGQMIHKEEDGDST